MGGRKGKMAKARATKIRGKWVVRGRDLLGRPIWHTCPNKKTAEALEARFNHFFTLGENWSPRSTNTAESAPVHPTSLWEVLTEYFRLKISQLSRTSQPEKARRLKHFQNYLMSRREDYCSYTADA